MRLLRITSGPAAGSAIEIDREVVLGRDSGDVTINDPELSRRHLALRPAEGGVELEDLGSLNGTFVRGERLSSRLIVTQTVEINFGAADAQLEITLPQATAPGQSAEPLAAAAVPMGQADAPNMTVQRPTAGEAPRDATVQRPAAVAGPPQPPGPPPPEAPAPSAPSGGRGRPPLALIGGGAVALIAAIVVAVLLLSGGDDRKKRTLDLRHAVVPPTERDKRISEERPGREPLTWTLVGTTRGSPFGTGSVIAKVTLRGGGPPPGAANASTPPPEPAPGAEPKPALTTVTFEMNFPEGKIVATERLETRKIGNSIDVRGTGRILRGTGEFEGATGSFKVAGSRPVFDEPFEQIHWFGTVEY